MTETMLDELAAATSIDKETLREKNMMTAEQCTPAVKESGAIKDYNMPRIWRELGAKAELDARKAAVDRFNAENRWKKRGVAMSPMRCARSKMPGAKCQEQNCAGLTMTLLLSGTA